MGVSMDILTQYYFLSTSNIFIDHYNQRHSLGGGGAMGANAPPIFFLPKNNFFFLATELKRGK
jgi:hypothetical protein